MAIRERSRILKNWNEMPEGIVVDLYDGHSETNTCKWEGRGFQFEAEEVYNCIKRAEIESRHFAIILAWTLCQPWMKSGPRRALSIRRLKNNQKITH